MTPPQEKFNQEVCTIRIMFPVSSDEEAIECKKKIAAALSDKPDAQIQFIIMGMPQGAGLGSQIR